MDTVDKVDRKFHLDWVDGLKAFAIVGILLNHVVEMTGSYPWFSNPSYSWPSFSVRMSNLIPDGSNVFVVFVKFTGWLGDMGPGVFILLSGFTLALSQRKKEYSTKSFYIKRITRIYPLYIIVHVIVLFAYIANSGFDILFDKNLIFSLLGVRFTDELFFYMNPSWWFMWVILQMYLIFPFAYKQLQANKTKFLIISISLTIISRLAGLIDITYSENLYFWMTGLFGGTRLFEFTFGMFLGMLYYENSLWLLNLLQNSKKTAVISFFIYCAGFLCSLFYWTTLFSNFLITIGLSGVFYSFYTILKQYKIVRKTLMIIGKASFPVFLLHQPFLAYYSGNFEIEKALILSIVTIVILIPIGLLLNSIVDKFIAKYLIRA